ncbi:MAG: hypothetical protein WAT22_10410 [Saprospiraceae bacterium]|nr:hypothetical protein [Saprospiraceae bacterium]MBK9567007.1 hypothetical protein [Saprospiraceae bacterium]
MLTDSTATGESKVWKMEGMSTKEWAFLPTLAGVRGEYILAFQQSD